MAAIHHPPRWFRSSAAGLECKRLQACKRKSYTGPWCMNTKKPPPPWVEFCLHPEVTWSTNEDLRRTPRPKNHYKIKEAYIIISSYIEIYSSWIMLEYLTPQHPSLTRLATFLRARISTTAWKALREEERLGHTCFSTSSSSCLKEWVFGGDPVILTFLEKRSQRKPCV